MLPTQDRTPESVDADDLTRLTTAAADGDQHAWAAIVDRFAGLVWAVARSYRLTDADAADVTQATWLKLVQHLTRIREPACLGAWLAMTTRREALGLLRRAGRDVPVGDAQDMSGSDGGEPPPEHRMLQVEQRAELWAAFELLPGRCRQLLRVLLADPPPSYQEAAAAVGIPVGSVGPTRLRCLAVLRRLLLESGRPAYGASSGQAGRSGRLDHRPGRPVRSAGAVRPGS